jgi:transposase
MVMKLHCKAVTGILEKHKVTDLKLPECHKIVTRYIGRGRGGKKGSGRKFSDDTSSRKKDNAAIFKHKNRPGWRVQVTNMPVEQMSLAEAVIHYRGGWSIERDFHIPSPVGRRNDILKDRPLGISPLYVRRDDQIMGLTCFSVGITNADIY